MSCFFILSATVVQPARAVESSAQQLWQLIDYVGADYRGAVSNGKVISKGEYAELVDFTDNALRLAASLPVHPEKNKVVAAISDLRDQVLRKGDSVEIHRLASDANALLVVAYKIPVSPGVIPELERGAKIYASQCIACHGANGAGDGPLSARLMPKPVAFVDAKRADARSLLSLYQAISQGVGGTAMPSFSSFSEADRWAVAFYIGTLSYNDAMRARGKALWRSDASIRRRFPDLAAVSTTTVGDAAKAMPLSTARDVTAYLRSQPGAVIAGKAGSIEFARARLKESLAALGTGEKARAMTLGLSAYLDGFEPLEPGLTARNHALVAEIESAMLTFRAAVARGTTQQAEEALTHLDQLFAQADHILGHSQTEPSTTFLGALTILLREGIEALLIVIGMVAFLKKASRADVLRYVHGGWISALCAGVLTWGVATYLVTISGARREVTEGLGSVLSAVILLSVGMWMHQKSSADRWQSYIAGKLSSALSQRSAWTLFALAFISVYREVFETVLFYSALAADGNGTALTSGFLAAVGLLGVVAWLLLRTSARMPIGRFFSVTSLCIAVLAVILAGKGVAALQEAGWVGVIPLSLPRIAVLGLFPTAQTVLAQTLVCAVAFIGFISNIRAARKVGGEAEERG
jgi:high-affinity iron transporter